MLQPTSNAARVKQINVELVKTALKAMDYGTKASMAAATGLSVATCGNILQELLLSGEVLELEPEEPNGGRPARRFRYDADYSLIVCLYVHKEGGVQSLAYAVANSIGTILEEREDALDHIDYDVIDGYLEEITGRYDNSKAIGIGIPGVVHQGVIGVCDVKELVQVPLASRLREKYGLDVTVENDMNLTVYGFYKRQNYDEDKTIAMVTFVKDEFPGAGIMVEGQILKGNSTFAGEVSFLPFGVTREEQLRLWNTEEGFLPLAVKTVASLAAVLNPETIAFTGELSRPELLDKIYEGCLAVIPEEHMPKLLWRGNSHEDYMYGLVSLTLESTAYRLKLVEKRM
jgi:hypothetical protein